MPENLADYYTLLELDPSVLDWPTIEQRIREKEEQWARDSNQGSPKARRRANAYRKQLPLIEKALRDEGTRRRAARAFEERRREEMKKALVELDAAIDVLGTVYEESQLDHLYREFGQWLSRDQIRQRLKARGIELGSQRKERVKKPKIDPSIKKKIGKELEHLGHKDLYEFLGMRPQSSPRALVDRADKIYEENRARGKNDDDTNARDSLVAFCKKLFGDEESKRTYDNTRADEAMEALEPNIKLAGSDKYITREEMDALVRQALQRGVAAEDARAYIEDYADQRKWGVQADGELPAADLRSCGFCGELAATGAKRCTGCGKDLDLRCPRCGTSNPTTNAACSQCGCLVGDAPRVEALLEEGKQRLLAGASDEALRCFDQALFYWPDWPPAKAARREVEARRKEQEQALAELEKEIRDLRLTTAQNTLGRLERRYGDTGLGALRQRIEEGMGRAREAFRRGEAQRQGGDREKAFDCFEEALAACVDFEPAIQALAQNPPPAPDRLEVEPLEAGFRLRWTAVESRRPLEYRVVRKRGGSPSSEDDGTLVGEVTMPHLDDIRVPPGCPFYYAVFSRRGVVHSRGAATSGPHLLEVEAIPVTHLEARRVGTNIVLTWRWPEGSNEVVVRSAHEDYLTDPVAGGGTRIRVTRQEYERAGCYTLRRAVARPHYFTVFARAGDEEIFAPAARVVESMGQGIEVSYEVVVKKALLRRSVSDAWLELVCQDMADLHLSELVVMGKARNLPLSPRDGELITEVPEVRFENGRARLPLPPKCFRHKPYVKLFFKDSARAREVRLLPAAKERLRVA